MQNNVSVGPTSVAGWGTAVAAFVGAVVTYLTGDHTAQHVTAIETASIGLVTLVITQVFRYLQAQNVLAPATVTPTEQAAQAGKTAGAPEPPQAKKDDTSTRPSVDPPATLNGAPEQPPVGSPS